MWSHALRILVAATAAPLVFAAPASADAAGYLHAVQPSYPTPTLSAEQLLSEGARVCRAIQSGMNSTQAVQMVQDDLGVSVPNAGDIVSAAVVHLDC